MKPTLGRIVLYRLNEDDVQQIKRRRTTGHSIAERIKEDKWCIGAQAHIGNEPHVSQQYPAMVVAIWSDTCVNLQVFLDGNDVLWKTSALQGEHEGGWDWPVKIVAGESH